MRQILHISDVHFGPHHAPEVADGVLDLVARRRPDLVAISGDLTQRAKPRQFREARAFVDRLGAPALAVPGNHDVPMYRFWERLLLPYGAYRKHFAADLEPDFEDDEMLVVGINSAYNWTVTGGRVRRARLRQVAARLDAAPPGAARVVVVHHELAPAPRFDTRRVLKGARAAVDVFARHGVELVLAGHLHQSYVLPSEAYYPTGGEPFLIVHAGTTTSDRGRGSERGRFTCNWVRVADSEIAVAHLGWDAAARRFAVWSRHCFPRRGGRSEPYGLEVP